PTDVPLRNVVAVLPGTDPVLKNEYVVIGGHNDHIGFNKPGANGKSSAVAHDSMYIVNHLYRKSGADDAPPTLDASQQHIVDSILAHVRKMTNGKSARPDSISNGADDDGTGTVSLLEIGEYFAKSPIKTKRSILFVWHVGEELGLWGSEYFTDHPTVSRDSIVAELNIDMVGRGGANDQTGATIDGKPILGGKGYLQLVGSRRLSTELGDIAERVNTSGKHNLKFDYALDANGHPANIYCRSDHYEYARYGIPIVFFTTGGHADYHQVTDEPQYIDYPHMAQVDSYIADLAVRVANLDHRPVVDKAKPDPHGSCQQ
ncbi:MAG: M28 family peptidase, partial [bacterium]